MNKSDNGLGSENDSENCLNFISGMGDMKFTFYLL